MKFQDFKKQQGETKSVTCILCADSDDPSKTDHSFLLNDTSVKHLSINHISLYKLDVDNITWVQLSERQQPTRPQVCAASPSCSGIPLCRAPCAPCRCGAGRCGRLSRSSGRCWRLSRSSGGCWRLSRSSGRCGAGAPPEAGPPGAVRGGAGPGLPALFAAPPLGVSLYHFSSSSNLEWKRVIGGKKSRDLGGFSEPCIQEANKIRNKKISTRPHPSAPLGAAPRLRDRQPDTERTGFVWRAISDRGRSIGLVGLSACRRREVAFDHFHCLPDGRIYMEVARHG